MRRFDRELDAMKPLTRRALIFLTGFLASRRAVSLEAPWTRLRRVVTSRDRQGRAVVIADGEPTNVVYFGGTRVTRLWESAGLPAELPLRADAGLSAGNAYRENFSGTAFYVTEIPGGERAPKIPMHRNVTLDYMAILSGRLRLKLPDRELDLQQGDTLIQGGNEHSFENPWPESCLLLFVVVSGRNTAVEPLDKL
jgi:mannose-6-phosphate isomerase-like protein (cupin superfamily)